MRIGVLTGDGEMYLFLVKKEIKEENIEEFLWNQLGISPENFNWQVLTNDGGQPRPALNFRIVEA